MKVLITVVQGLLAAILLKSFQGKAEVLVLDNLRSGFKRNLAGFETARLSKAQSLDRMLVQRIVHWSRLCFLLPPL